MGRVLRALAVALCCLAAPAGAATLLYVYDELGRLVAEIDPAAETTLYHYDAAGNLLSVARGDSSEFRLIAFTPTRGKEGDTVTIYGSGFVPDAAQNAVSFNGTPAVLASASAHVLVATVPPGVTTGPIAVSNANGSAVTAQPFVVVFPPVIDAVNPSGVSRGATTRLTISGAHLATTQAVGFEQAGMAARVVPGASDTEVSIDLKVAGTVPLGTYAFSVTTDAGTTHSGAVTVNVTTDLLGDVVALTQPLSVHLRPAVPGAPAGDSMSVAPSAVSVHLPAPVAGTPDGNALSVTPVAVSVHLPPVISGGPAGDALSATPVAVSVHLPAVISGAPTGDAMSVAQPASVSMP